MSWMSFPISTQDNRDHSLYHGPFVLTSIDIWAWEDGSGLFDIEVKGVSKVKCQVNHLFQVLDNPIWVKIMCNYLFVTIIFNGVLSRY